MSIEGPKPQPDSASNSLHRWMWVETDKGFMFHTLVTDKRVLDDLIHVRELRRQLDTQEKPGPWKNMFVSFDGVKVRLYINGVLEAETEQPCSFQTWTQVEIERSAA